MGSDREEPLGVGWYRREQWEKLLELSADCEGVQKTYDQWLAGAEKAVKTLEKQGCSVVKIPVDVIAMASWCVIQGLAVTASSRAKYVKYKMGQG